MVDKRRDFVRQVVLVDEAWLGEHLDERVRARPRVSPHVQLMPDVFDRRMAAAVGTQTLNAAETFERRRPWVAVETVTGSHGVSASAEIEILLSADRIYVG